MFQLCAAEEVPQCFVVPEGASPPVVAPDSGTVATDALPPGLNEYSSRSALMAAFPNSFLEDFEEAQIADGSVASFLAPLDMNTNNAYFSPGDILPGIILRDYPMSGFGIAILGKGFVGAPSKQIGANLFSASTDIIFPRGTHAVGMDIYSLFGNSTVTIDIYDTSGVLIGSTSKLCNTSGAFWGVSSATRIRRVSLNALTFAETIDNVVFYNPPVGGELLPDNVSTTLMWVISGISAVALSIGLLSKKIKLF